MIRYKHPEDHIILLLLLFTIHAIGTHAGATSPQKNLVNLYTNSPNENLNASNTNSFQNEYQHHQGISKLAPSDRYKSSTTSYPDVSATDHTISDVNGPSLADDSYQDVRVMTNVPECKGRLKLNGTRGFITDGPGYYQTNLQCIWLIDSGRDKATIRIQVHQFNTECNYDFLYIFDGNSIYSPLVAALSGDMKDFSSAFVEPRLDNLISSQDNKQINSRNSIIGNQTTHMHGAITSTASESRPFELKTESGKAFIYFHSDTAQSMPGFYMTYSIDACPLDCSNRGECDYTTLGCKCNPGYFGDGCQYILCPNNCTSPINGRCDEEKSCICNQGFHGLDCSRANDIQVWVSLANVSEHVSARAFHQSIIVNDTMWVIGGKTPPFSNTNTGIFKKESTRMVMSFDLPSQKWTDFNLDGLTGVDHLAELSGHSVAASGDKVFIYGGLAMNNTVLDTLTVLDTKAKTIDTLISPKQAELPDEQLPAPLAVVGHSAVVVDGNMYIFLGYNPIFGYLNFVQKFNIANNSWSMVEKKGSSIPGVIGHSSTFDPVDRLVYIYGGHNAFRSNRLYSFDPQSELWKFLHPGPSPRYYHSSAIINRQLIIFGGNSYNTSHQSDQCFHQTYLTFDLNCNNAETVNMTLGNDDNLDCARKCWKSIEDDEPGVLKRHGHSIVARGDQLILFGGFNGIFMRDVRVMNIGACDLINQESDCAKARPALDCLWNASEKRCELASNKTSVIDSNERTGVNCSKNYVKQIQNACEARGTCTECLSTNLGCVWCGTLAQCHYGRCKSSGSKIVVNAEFCYKDESTDDSNRTTSTQLIRHFQNMRKADLELDCEVDNCYLCHTKPHCSWLNEVCSYNTPNVIGPSRMQLEDPNETYSSDPFNFKTIRFTNGTRIKLDRTDKSFFATLANTLMYSSQFATCDVPCYLRHSCNECTTTKCIWCSTTERCIDSTAYFAYHAAGQCMHYVAHMLKCPIASCSDIETCDKCLTNPKCGWLNDISNTGKGRCIEGTNSGPTFGSFLASQDTVGSNITNSPLLLSNWHYTSCPSCQCNGHSYCKPNSSLCVQSCQDNTEGPHCDRCIQGYFGDPINGGICRPCRCNGHAQACNRETGKCYCSTKGIVGHYCNRCDDKNYYLGDPSSPGNGTCYYNLTTDYQYTFNMSKPEDHFYSDINFVNIPLRKDSDVDFTIACSRLALVNITAGTSYKNRRQIHTSLECGSFRLRFPHDRLGHVFTDTNYSFFVHVHKFQTPFILQIAFSQHRTLYLPQFFFTFSRAQDLTSEFSCFLFFFALSGLVWKLKHEYDLYVRRQRQFIEMEQMASRPFSAVLLEISKPSLDSKLVDNVCSQKTEPTPISFEPCFGSNIGVMSLFVQLPGRPNLAIGSALVTLNDDNGGSIEDECPIKRSDKEYTSIKNM